MKAATQHGSSTIATGCISIHAAREGGDVKASLKYCRWKISIHAAREGGDAAVALAENPLVDISIHAAREGGDQAAAYELIKGQDFNPRRP